MKIEEALNFTFNSENFIISSEFVVNKALQQEIEKRIKRLKKIEQKVINAEIPKDNNIHHALLKFKLGLEKGDAGMFLDSIRLYRRLAYCFSLKHQDYDSILSSYKETEIALSILENNWKDSFIIGLFGSLLSKWEDGDKDAILTLRSFIFKKLKEYSGNRKLLNSIKDNIQYFENKDSAIKLGLYLFYQKVNLSDFTNYLNFPKDWIKYSFFSSVIVAYFEKTIADISTYEQVIDFLEIHNLQGTYKKILSKMIIYLNDTIEPETMQLVRETAFANIGDSSIDAKWSAPPTFDNEEKSDLQNAQDILNQWITSQFITVFFEVCINDFRRKKFWLKRSKNVRRFRIFGSENMYNQLRNDSRVSKFVKARFCITSDRNVAAIMMHINNHSIIEFSNDGFACIAYKMNSSYCPVIDKNIETVKDLVNSGMNVISVRNGHLADYYSEEGRLMHRNDWEIPFNQFLERHVVKKKQPVYQ